MNFLKIILFAFLLSGFSVHSTAAFQPTSGEFVDADPVHQATGSVRLGQQNANYVLKFVDFYVTPGPDLYVMLVKNPTPNSSQAVKDSQSFELAKLKSPSGDQTYQLDLDIDPNEYGSVVIWCKQYGVLFGYAELN